MNQQDRPQIATVELAPERGLFAWLRRRFGGGAAAVAEPETPLLPPLPAVPALPPGDATVTAIQGPTDQGVVSASREGEGMDEPLASTQATVSDEATAIIVYPGEHAALALVPPPAAINIDDAFLSAAIAWLRLRIALLDADDGAPDQATERRTREARAELERLAMAMPAPRFVAFGETFGLSPFERDLLLLCLVHALVGEGADWSPTFALALRVADDPAWDRAADPASAGPARLAAEADWGGLSPVRPLRHWELIEITQPAGRPLLASTLRADERIVNHLKGLTYLDDRLARFCRPLGRPAEWTALSTSQREITHAAWRRIGAAGIGRAATLVQFAGGDPATKQLLARHLAVDLEVTIFSLPLAQAALSPGDLDLFARLWSREARLQPLALYLDAAEIAETAALQRLLDRIEGIVILDYPAPLPGHSATVPLDAARPRATEQREAWQARLADPVGDWPQRLAGQFSLNLPEMDEVIATARAEDATGAREGARVWAICRDRARPRLDGLAQRLPATLSLDAVKLPAPERRLLDQIRDQTRQRLKVYDEFGFRDRLGQGLGISALFAGESGTGKTMAAEGLAHDLGLDLYRIDLATVVSKYIGESEKNLRRIFDAAEQSGAVLLFDEADALFGKRSEVKDSHDRYANIEVSYLLQRMESYEGLAILTTNMKSALDPAFLRRLRFIVTFPFPGAAEREAIWRAIFPDRAVGKDDLDYAALARPSLTGGQIRNIALNAAFLAAARDEVLTMALLKESARDELRKQGKPLNAADFVAWESPGGEALSA